MQGSLKQGRTLIWERNYRGITIERAVLRNTERGWCINGEVVGAVDESPVSAKYSIFADTAWQVHACVVESENGSTRRRRILTRRGDDWIVDGSRENRLAGCDALDLGFTPSTNTLALNQLSLPVGGQREIVSAYVDFPSLDVSRSRQSYIREEAARYEYRNIDSGFAAPLEVDAGNVVIRYGSVWRRLAATRAVPAADVLSDGRTREFCLALASAERSTELGPRGDDFNWLVGGWAGTVRDFSGGTEAISRGEWWFSWILEGRAMQDVWMVPPQADRDGASRSNNRFGTTTRRFDLSDGLWHIAWINPVTGRHNELQGRRTGDRIVLDGTQEGARIRWSFSDITPTSFRWTGERLGPDAVWRMESEFLLERLI